jgi:putative transposase
MKPSSAAWKKPATGSSSSPVSACPVAHVRTTNSIERLLDEFKRRIKTQTVQPSADTAALFFWALLASGQITMRKVGGLQTLATKPIDQPIDLAA